MVNTPRYSESNASSSSGSSAARPAGRLIHFWNDLDFRGRLTTMIVSLVLAAVLLVASLVYFQYRDSYTQATINQLQGTGEMMNESFTQWLNARQDEMRYLASLNPVRQLHTDDVSHLLARTSELGGFYDTIFLVGADGRGIAGAAYENGHTRQLPPDEARAFDVANRDWFRQAIGGDSVFSQPLVSRATGNQISNVVVPVHDTAGNVVAVVRGAVRLDVLFERMETMSLGGSSDTYLIAANGTPVTPVAALQGRMETLSTYAAEVIARGQDGVGQYHDTAGTPVIGAFSYLPRLNWGLVVEVPQAEALAEVTRVFWLLVVITAIIIAVAMIISLAVVRSVVRILGGDPQDATDVVRRVVQGDLSANVPLMAGDKTSLLAHMQEMQVNLRQMMVEIRQTTESVSLASNEIAQGNDNLATRTEEQSSSLVETAASVEQMTATIRQTADSANQARLLTEEVDNKTATAGDVGQQAARAMGAIKEAHQRVTSIIEAIDGIAFQTNLLALNASVEAARAGDHGRGFAVVAAEVRGLAGRCAAEADQVRAVVAASIEKVSEGEKLVNSSSEQLQIIGEDVRKASRFVAKIACAAEEQAAGIEQINTAISQLEEVTQQNAALVVEASVASQSLDDQARELAVLLRRFRLEQGRR